MWGGVPLSNLMVGSLAPQKAKWEWNGHFEQTGKVYVEDVTPNNTALADGPCVLLISIPRGE